MKKLIAISFILFVSAMNAQVTFKPGLRAGAAFSTFSNTRSDYKTDFYIGGFGEIKLTKIYTLQPEITYTRQGSNNVKTYIGYNNGEDIIEYRDLEINYVSIAVINKFTFNDFQVQVGPTIDFRTSDNLIHEKSDVDLTFVAGFGYKVPATGLTVEARVKKGLVDVIDSDYYGSNSNDADYLFGDYNTNVSFQLGVSYAFGK